MHQANTPFVAANTPFAAVAQAAGSRQLNNVATINIPKLAQRAFQEYFGAHFDAAALAWRYIFNCIGY